MKARATVVTIDPIARYIAALDRRLCGPRRFKADILREVQHGLQDAAQGYQEAGVPTAEAACRAVAEFGEPDDIAGPFQTELAARQARFTLGFLAVTGPVSEVAVRILWSNSPAGMTQPSDFAILIAQAVDYMAWTMSIVAALALVGFGLGARWFAVRPRLVRVVAVSVMAKMVLMVSGGIMLTALFEPGQPQGAAAVFETVMSPLWVLMPSVLLWLAWRCWRVAARTDELSAV